MATGSPLLWLTWVSTQSMPTSRSSALLTTSPRGDEEEPHAASVTTHGAISTTHSHLTAPSGRPCSSNSANGLAEVQRHKRATALSANEPPDARAGRP